MESPNPTGVDSSTILALDLGSVLLVFDLFMMMDSLWQYQSYERQELLQS